MTPKSLLGLGIVTAVVAVAAAVGVARQHTVSQSFQDDSPVISGLEDKLNSVAEFSVKTGEGTFTIRRKGDIWTMAEKGDYPVNQDVVRTMLFQLSQLRLAEAKTQMPERYPRIEVEDVDAKDAKSALLTVKDGSGGVLANLLVGKIKSDATGGGGAGVYLRKPGEAQAWLARGAFEMPRTAEVWLVKNIVDIGEKRIRRVVTIQPGGEKVTVFKDKPEDRTFTLEGVPEGKKAKDSELSGFGTALSGLDLGDVMPAARRPLPADKATRAEITTFDGLVIHVVLEKGDKGIYAHFEASAQPARGEPKAGENKIDVAKEAQDINARVGNWVYMVPEYKLSAFLKKRGELIEG